MAVPSITPYQITKATFSHVVFVASEDDPPNLKFLLSCAEYLAEYTQSHPHSLRTTGHRYMAIIDIMWALQTADPYPGKQANSGANMVYPQGTHTL